MRHASFLFAACAVVALASVAPARAQSFRLDGYRPAPTVRDGFTVERPIAPGHLRPAFDLHVDYANQPLVVDGLGPESVPYVEHLAGLHVGVALGLFDRLLVHARLPVVLALEGADAPGFPPTRGAGLSDLALGARWLLVTSDDERFALATSLVATVPTAGAAQGDQQLAGEAGVTFTPSLVGEARPVDGLQITGTVGVRFREAARLPNLEMGHEVTFGLGVGYWFLDDLLEARIETWASSSVERFGEGQTSPWETLLGVRVQPFEGFIVGLAGGPGLGRGVGTPTFRGVFSVGWTPDIGVAPTEDSAARATSGSSGGGAREEEDGATARADASPAATGTEGDDAPFQDVVPDTPPGVEPPPDPPYAARRLPAGETARRYAELDRDGDRIMDSQDRCPIDPEDFDEIADRDGCPEADADGDGVADQADHCPLTRGADGSDACAGCPERACMARGGSIVIGERVEFAVGTADIEAASLDVLRDVVSILQTNPQIERVRIEGHTDAVGNDSDNLALSTARARAIIEWLRAEGVDAERLEAWGCGEMHPVDDNARSEGRQRNRRVEFLIIVPSSGQPLREGCRAAR